MLKMLSRARSKRTIAIGVAASSLVTVGMVSTAAAVEPAPALPATAEIATDQYGNWAVVGAAENEVLTQAAPDADPAQTATTVLNTYAPGFGISDGTTQFVAREPRNLDDGGAVVRFDQHVSGIPVFASGVAVRLDQDKAAMSVSSSIVPTARTTGMDLSPTIDQNAAIELARTAIPADANGHKADPNRLSPTTPEMMVYDPDLIGGDPNQGVFNGARLVWSLSLANSELGLSYRFLIDAVEPTVLLAFSETEQALQRYVCDFGNGFEVVQCRNEGNGPFPGLSELNNGYTFAGQSYTYFKNQYGRDSFDGKGAPIFMSTRICGEECPLNNAYWDGEQLLFGDGFASADDIVGHEFTHGVTQYEANLMYYAESGAINESMSDVFGEFIDQAYDTLGNDTAANKWLMGEQIGAGRNMANPGEFGDPDRMLSPNYALDIRDNYGVHTNSGVNNKAAVLMAAGGNFNGQNVAAIGNTKTSAIYYEALSSILTPGSDYSDLYVGLQRACKNLIGTKGITSGNCKQVKKAVTATEMNKAAARRLTASRECADGTQTSLFSDDAESGMGKWVINDRDGWRASRRAAQSGTHSFFSPNPGSGNGNGGRSLAMTTKERVKIPWTGTSYLWFDHNFWFESQYFDGLAHFDGGVVEYSFDGRQWFDLGSQAEAHGYNGTIYPAAANPISGRKAFTSVSRGFQQTRISLKKLRGANIFVRFRLGADAGGATEGWHIDDVNVYNCASAPVRTNFESGYQAITPQRLIDTRSDVGLVKAKGVRPAGSVLKFNAASLPIFKNGDTPTALNLTVTTAKNAGPGHVTVYPCGKRPTTSTLNATSANLIVVNTATIPIAANGQMCIYNHAKTHLIVDVAGYQTSTKGSAPPSRYQPLTPRRLVDTRNSDGLVKVEGPRTAGSTLQIEVAGLGIFAADTTPRALDLTITAVNNTGPGHVTAYPCGQRPNTTVLNTYRASQVVSNTATVPVSGSDKLCIYTHTTTDLIVDIAGYYSTTRGPQLGTYKPITPRRVLDTRNNDGLFANKGIRPAGSTLKINMNRLGIQKSGQKPTAYDLTFTMILNQSFGHITVYPCGGDKPTAATMTAAQPGMVIANTATIPVNANGEICVYTNPQTHLTIDVTGYHYK